MLKKSLNNTNINKMDEEQQEEKVIFTGFDKLNANKSIDFKMLNEKSGNGRDIYCSIKKNNNNDGYSLFKYIKGIIYTKQKPYLTDDEVKKILEDNGLM